MRGLVTILSIILFSYIQFYNAGVWVSYEINKSEIIQQFCENKDKPKLKCEGTCHMKKMMIDESQEDNGLPIVVLPEMLLYFVSSPVEMRYSENPVKYLSHYINYYTFEFLKDWVIPPKV